MTDGASLTVVGVGSDDDVAVVGLTEDLVALSGLVADVVGLHVLTVVTVATVATAAVLAQDVVAGLTANLADFLGSVAKKETLQSVTSILHFCKLTKAFHRNSSTKQLNFCNTNF